MVRIPDEKKKTELRSRYDPDFVIAKLSSIEQGQQTILDDEDYEDDEKGRGTHNFNGKGDNGPEFSKPSEQKKSSDSKDNLQGNETFQDNKDIDKENYSENNTNENDKVTLKINAQESKEYKKTDTPLKNDSPHRPLSPDLQGEPSNSDVQNENASRGDGDLKKDKLKKDEERARAYIENLKKQWAENPRKALFNFIEKEAPKTKYRSMTPKAILDMLPVPDVELSYIAGLCEDLSREGAFIKNRGGAYSINPEFLNGGEYQ